MQLNELRDDTLKRKHKKCLGRGIGSSKGKTCGRGHKGQKARTGKSIKGFEGGQMPLERRLPKRGFTSLNKDSYSIISFTSIQDAIDSGKIDPSKLIDEQLLQSSGVIKKLSPMGVKLLYGGELKSKIDLQITAISKSAKEKLLSNGSTINVN